MGVASQELRSVALHPALASSRVTAVACKLEPFEPARKVDCTTCFLLGTLLGTCDQFFGQSGLATKQHVDRFELDLLDDERRRRDTQ